MTSDADRNSLLSIARNAISEKLAGRRPTAAELLPTGVDLPDGTGGAFVTLKIADTLRGCIGHLVSEEPIAVTVAEMARSAAFNDPRFPPLTVEEFNDISIEISRLSEFFPIEPAKVETGIHGLLMRQGYRSGILLPQVPGEQGWTRKQYLSGLCRKSGLPDGAWEDPETVLEAFTAEVFGED